MILYYLIRWSILFALGLLIYGQTFHFGFVFDDYLFIVTNPFIKNLNNFHVMWHAFPMTRLVGMYSFALNYYFCQLNPSGYHVFNFSVHLAATGLVWALAALLFRITKFFHADDTIAKELPFLIAVLFLVHPCQTQAVTYITQRFESMATVFYLATLYFYLQARLAGERRYAILFFGLAALATSLGILTKEVMVTIPAMIVAVEWILIPKKSNGKVLIGFLVLGGLLFLLLSKMLHAGSGSLLHSIPSESHDGDILTPVHYFLTQMRVFLTFMRLFMWPVNQNLDYDYPASTGVLHPPLTLIGIMMIVGIIFLIIKLRRRLPLVAFGLAWILITFSINLAPRSNVIFEHKLYLISFGFFLTLMTTLTLWIKDSRTLLKAVGCIIVILAVMSYERNKVWANELALWEDNIKHSPHKARVNASLGRMEGSIGRYEKAIDYLSRAILIKPDNISYENRGIIYSLEGKTTQALEDLNKSIGMEPDYFPTYVKRAWVYQKLHIYREAMADLDHAIELAPYFTDAYIERGMLSMQMQRYDLALADFTKAQALEPANTQIDGYKSLCLTKMRLLH